MRVNNIQRPEQTSLNKRADNTPDLSQEAEKTGSNFPQEASKETSSDVIEKNNTSVTLSVEALQLQGSDIGVKNKPYAQRVREYEVAKKDYDKRVGELPNDYRKMKMAKDAINEEIQALKDEIAKIEQSMTLNEEEAEEKILALKQQIANKSMVLADIDKAFNQKIDEQKRYKQISSEQANEMLDTFYATPPQPPERR